MRVGIGSYIGSPGGEDDPLRVALVDALLGAAGLGSVRSSGRETPDGGDLLARAVRLIERENYQVVNVDASLDGEPDPGIRSTPVAERLAETLHVSPAAVSVKWSVGDPPGAGRVRARVVALLDQMRDIDALHASIRGG